MLALPNFANQLPAQEQRCSAAMEGKLHVDAAWELGTTYGVSSKATMYRHLALLSDRMCVYCERSSPKLSCRAGSFKCTNCYQSGGDVPFAEGFKAWLEAGSPIRHGEQSSPCA